MPSISELLTTPYVADRRLWGPWKYEPGRLSLSLYLDGRWQWDVDLEEIQTEADVLRAVLLVAGKVWATPIVVAGLVWGLKDVFHMHGGLVQLPVASTPPKLRKQIASNLGVSK